MTLSPALQEELGKEQAEQTKMTSTSQRLGRNCGGYNLKADERYFSKSTSLAQGGRGHWTRVGTWETQTGAACTRLLTVTPKPDPDSSGNREPPEGVGPFGGGAVHSDSWNHACSVEERGERPEAGHWVKGYCHKVRVSSGPHRKKQKSRYKRECGRKTLIHLRVLFPPYQHLHCH